MPEDSAGFWSYAREDDERDGGRIVDLAKAVADEYALLTGRDLTLFIDRELDWGEQWRVRIDEALAATTFFIPIITPRYFQRTECRRELLTFAGHAKSLGREELLLPIYYVTVREIDEDEKTDEAVELVTSMNWSDWRALRLEDPGSAAYRREVSELAGRLATIAHELESQQDVAAVSGEAITSVDDGIADEDEPGTLELVAAAEEAFPRFNATIEQIGRELEGLGELADRWTPIMSRAAEKGAGATLHAVKQFAQELDGPAGQVEELGRLYSADLVQIDPGVLTLIRQAELEELESEEALELFSTIMEMAENGDVAMQHFSELFDTFAQVGSLSRDLRRPIKRMQDGLKNVLDGQTVLDEWRRRAEQVRRSLLDEADDDVDAA